MRGRSHLVVWVSALGLGASVAWHAHAATPQDYARGRQLEVPKGAALGVYTLPLDVLVAVQGDLSRTAIFNGRGEVVPFGFRIPEVEVHTVANRDLPLFPVGRSETGKAGAATAVEVTTQEDGTLTRVRVEQGSTAPRERKRTTERYLVDASTFKQPIESLTFTVRPHSGGDADFTWALRIVAGGSLDRLTRATYTGTLAHLNHQGTSLSVATIETPGLDEPYLAITWDGEAPGVIERIEARATTASRVEQARTTELSPSRAIWTGGASAPQNVGGGRRFGLVYDIQADLPLRRMQLDLRGSNAFANVDIFLSSKRPRDATQLGSLLFSGNVYRLTNNGATFDSPPVGVNASGRYVTVTARQPASEALLGLNEEAPEKWPRLTVEYAPAQALFVASGEPPFTLAYGSWQASQAQSASEILAVAGSVNAGNLERDNVTSGSEFVLGTPSAPQEPLPWKRIGLWAVLILGVGVLLAMTRGLVRRAGP